MQQKDQGVGVTEAELIEAEQYARRFGSANCWTGTSGTLAGHVIHLIREVRTLRDLVRSLTKDDSDGLQSVRQGQGPIQGR